MKVNLILWEDILCRNFYPLSLTRPTFELRAGALTFRERAIRYFPNAKMAAICREEMRDITSDIKMDTSGNSLDKSLPTILMCGRTFFDRRSIKYIKNAKTTTVFVSENIPVAVFFVPGDDRWRQFFDRTFDIEFYRSLFSSFDAVELSVVNTNLIWELIVNNDYFIREDFKTFYMRSVVAYAAEPKAVLHNPNNIFIGRDAKIEPFAVLDARNGPIIIESGAHIASGAIVMGPSVIGTDTIVMPYTRIREETTIGPTCRIGGEIEASIFIGNSNKYHDGFLGHSYIGEWVNIGAMATNSDLKNNYGEIRVAMPEGTYMTGYNKIGTFMGDHVKIGIGTLIPSGSTIGVAVNFYGGGTMAKYTPSFLWGSHADGFTHYDLDKAIDTAQIVMKRRDREFSRAQDQLMRRIHGFYAEDRTNFIYKQKR